MVGGVEMIWKGLRLRCGLKQPKPSLPETQGLQSKTWKSPHGAVVSSYCEISKRSPFHRFSEGLLHGTH